MSIKSFLQESKQEFKRVNWPTKDETIRMTLIVFAICIFTAIFLGGLDYGFLKALEKIAAF